MLNGATGEPAVSKIPVSSSLYKIQKAFPFRTHGRIMSPVLIVRLHDHLPQQACPYSNGSPSLLNFGGARMIVRTISVQRTAVG